MNLMIRVRSEPLRVNATRTQFGLAFFLRRNPQDGRGDAFDMKKVSEYPDLQTSCFSAFVLTPRSKKDEHGEEVSIAHPGVSCENRLKSTVMHLLLDFHALL